jgi:ribosomal protein S27AE
MNVQAAHRALSTADFSPPQCPRCGSIVRMAEHSAFSSTGRIRHTWCCDDCGQEFVTSIRVFSSPALTKAGR